MGEKRATPRVRILKGGSIIFGTASTVDCVVRNLSEAGACLEVASPVGIPDDFNLQIKPETTKRDCHVVWRSANRIGVYFNKAVFRSDA
jgi:PilZ domain-containing protein